MADDLVAQSGSGPKEGLGSATPTTGISRLTEVKPVAEIGHHNEGEFAPQFLAILRTKTTTPIAIVMNPSNPSSEASI